jgi:GTP-binding protein HflX
MNSAAPTPSDKSNRCVVAHVYARAGAAGASRTPAAALEEAVSLAGAINLQVVHSAAIGLARMNAATLIGPGHVAAIKQYVESEQAGLVVINHALAPIQQRNLETELGCKVIDRTGLILEIFGERARTREGQLQVELAALTYQQSRLVRSWTHLERQRGGFGFMGGPGERQIELDRRMIGTRIDKIKAELAEVRRTRGLQRHARVRREQPVVALVGYTNAGKSTLFNTLTAANVLAQDMLFATLDPTMRDLPLPSGRSVMLADTVGFIADLPTHLVESFRATLEEVESADLILHVRDVAHPDTDAQRADVLAVLASMGIEADDARLVEVLNKVDLLDTPARNILNSVVLHRRAHDEKIVSISAITGQGLDELQQTILDHAFEEEVQQRVQLPHTAGAALAWLYEHANIISRTDTDAGVEMDITISLTNWQRFQKMHHAHT